MLYIFKLNQSTKKDKLPNRKIRNELVGHPVNRSQQDNKLQSSVIFGKNNGKGYIHYIRYERENNFKFKDVVYNIKDIINYHENFLNKYLDNILKKLHNILKNYKKVLYNLLNIILKKNQFLKLLDLSEKYYPYIFKYNFLFQKEIMIDCYNKRSNHFRYEKAVNDFLSELETGIRETTNKIEEILTDKKECKSKNIENIEVNFVPAQSNSSVKKTNNNFRYHFEKLSEKKYLYLNIIETLKERFKDNNKIVCELENMEQNTNNDLEYYSSLNYLKMLINKKITSSNMGLASCLLS